MKKNINDEICRIIDDNYPDLSTNDKHEIFVLLSNKAKAIILFEDEFMNRWDGKPNTADATLRKIIGAGMPSRTLDLYATLLMAQLIKFVID